MSAMKKKILFTLILSAFVCCRSLLFGCAQAPLLVASDVPPPLAPAESNPATCREILSQLQRDHYAHPAIDDPMSEMMFDRYLSDLDPGRTYFITKDIKEFERFRFRLDDDLGTGNLEPAFAIFNRYQQRLAECLEFMIARLEQGVQDMDFTAEESLETERKKEPWPKNESQLKDLWQKRLKAALLNLKLADKKLDDARDILLKRYRSQLNQARQMNSEDVFQLYINALTQSCDPHTEYLPPRVSENFNISMSLSLQGIGAVLQSENEYTKIVSLVPGGPADKMKQLKPGDRITGVGQGPDGEIVSVVGWRLDDVVQLIRGPKKTVVRLETIPANADDEHQTRIISITRDTVKLEEQAAKKKTLTLPRKGKARRVGVIDVPAFYLDFKGLQSHSPGYKSTTQDVRRLIQELEAEHVDGIIVDLRDNAGGSLQEATMLTGLFIKEGPIVQVRNAKGSVTVIEDPDSALVYKGPLAVLVNRMSASASEIVAAAIQDYGRGIIIGEQTFGKGTVQALVSLRQGQLKITQAKFYRISGGSTQQKGVTPDIWYPSLYDMEKIGESTLPCSLPWDTIEPASYKPLDRPAEILAGLTVLHEGRIKDDPDYQYLTATIDLLKNIRGKPAVSLCEATRRREDGEIKSERLAIENKRRAAKKLPLLEKLSELDSDADNATEEAVSKKSEDDPELSEAGNILLDYTALKAQK